MHKNWDKENNQLIILLIISFFTVYYLPVIVARVLFVIFILYAFRTKKDYFWLAFFFILNDAPGRLFSSSSGAEEMRMPLYTIVPGVSLGFQELYTLAYLLKAIFSEQRLNFVFRFHFRWFYFFGAFMVVYSLILGMNLDNIITTIRVLMPWAWVMILPFFIRDRETLIKVTRLLFPMIFFALASQIFAFFTGTHFDGYFRGTAYVFEEVSVEGEALRSGSSGFILLFTIIQGLFYLSTGKHPFSRNYLFLMIIVASLSMILTGTRGWIIAIMIIYIGIIPIIAQHQFFRSILQTFIITVILLWVLQAVFPVIGTQIDNSFSRLSTMESLMEGDMTAGGTLSRLTERGPKVMSKFIQNPLLGWGFTKDFYFNADGHVGNQNLLLNVGIIGFIILNLIFFGIFHTIWTYSRHPAVYANYGNSIKIFAIAMLGVFFIHSTSTQFWGYAMSQGQPLMKTLFYAFFLCSVNTLIISAVKIPSRKKGVMEAVPVAPPQPIGTV